MKPIKIIVVGDSVVGKTQLLTAYVTKEDCDEYVPRVFDNHINTITVDDKEYVITLWDTAGQEDYERLRVISYPNTDCFLVCYAINSKISFENVIEKWIPEIRHFSSKVPIVLVGTKSDLRVEGSKECISLEEGKRLEDKIGAYSLVECSAKNRTNITKIFEEAVRSTERKNLKLMDKNCSIS